VFKAIAASVASLLATFALLMGTRKLVPASEPAVQWLLTTVLQVGLGFLVVRLLARTLLGSSAREIGFRASLGELKQLAFGVSLGIALVTLSFCVAWSAGGLQVTLGQAFVSTRMLALDTAATVFASTFEEVMFRAGMTAALLRGRVLPRGVALMIPSAIFGLMHGMNPGASTISVANTILAGLLLALLYTRKGLSMAAPIGFHVAWNLVLGRVFGVAVSGQSAGRSFLDAEPLDILWSGGSYGIEAGLGTLFILTATSMLLVATAPNLRATST
jgi:uncharacterized protein